MKIIFRKTAFLFVLVLSAATAINAQKEELKLEILNGHSGGGVLAVAVSSDGKFALTGSTDNTALLWDLETGKQLRRFVGHESSVSAVQFSKDGQFVLTASHDKTARLWETATGKEVLRFIGHTDKILSAAISANGNLVATAGKDKTARIWDLKTGKQLFEIEHAGRVNSIAFSPDSALLLTGGEDKIARFYRTSSGELVRQFVGHTGEITAVAYSPNGLNFVTGSKDSMVCLWNEKGLIELKEIPRQENIGVLSIAFMPNGNEIGIGSDLTFFWNTKKKVLEYMGDKGLATSIAITKDGKQILIAHGESSNGFVSVLYTATSAFNIALSGKSDIVSNIAVSTAHLLIGTVSVGSFTEVLGDNKTEVYAQTSRTSGFWNLEKTENFRFWLDETTNTANTIRKKTTNFIQSKYEPVSYYQKNKNLAKNKSNLNASFIMRQGNFSESISFSSKNDLIAVSKANQIEIWDSLAKKQIQNINMGDNTFGSYNTQVKSSSISNLLLSSLGSNIQLWNLETGKEIKKYEGHNQEITSIDFSLDEKIIASTSRDKTVRLWNAETGEVKQIIKDFLAPVWSVAFSLDGKTIAAASGGEVVSEFRSEEDVYAAKKANSVRFFDVETGKEKEIERIDGFEKEYINKVHGFKSVAYSPDGKFLAAGSFDGKVYLHDNETKNTKIFRGHTDAVNSVKFAKDANGKLLVVSGSSDSTTRIWDAATGEEICALVTFRDGNWAVVQTKTGRYDAPNGSEIDGIQWVYGTETIELKQLSAMYYTPNLLPRLLGYNKDPLPAVVPLSDVKLYPSVIEQKFDEQTRKLNVKLKARNGGIGKTEVYVKGKITDKSGNVTEAEKLVVADARDEKLKQNPNVPAGEIVNLSVDLPKESFVKGSENQIKVVTSNYLKEIGKGNIQSRGAEIVYLDERKEDLQLPTLYAIVGGVSDYAGDGLKLRFAAKDAEDFSNALQLGARRLFGVEKVNITTLSTERRAPPEQPTKENFKRAVEEIAKKAKPEDIFLIYLSGHGVTLGTGTDTYFYLTKDARSTSKTDLETNFQTVAISNAELVDWLTPDKDNPNDIYIKALKQVVILDTCAAGNFAAEDWKKDRDGLTGDQIRAMEFLKNKTGTFILMGSAANAVSYEANTYNQGLLTYSLLEGMKGLALQKPTENVDVRLLFDYAEKRVETLAKALGLDQRPLIKQPSGNTFVIGQMSDTEKQKIDLPQPKPLMLRPLLTAPPLGNDPLKLIPQLGKLLDAESSYAVVRQRGEKEPKIIYIDDDNFPGAVRVTGTYSVTGETVKVKAYLVRDETVVAELPEIVSTKEKVLDELLKAVQNKFLKN